ncbi:MAG: hypothetical protein JNL88_10830 [Bacteroidia bacterium]|nr:hypothetical protein [Bacteroidia bacterium]
MKWTYSFKNQLTAAILLFIIMSAVLLNNLSERNKSEQISDAVSSMYKDRLLVESYIFRYSQNLQRINEIISNEGLATGDRGKQLSVILADTKNLNDAYRATKLTAAEAKNFSRFVLLSERINRHVLAGEWNQALDRTREATGILQVLSSIQVSEAQQQMSGIDKLFSTGHLHSQFEIALLLVLGMIVLAMVLASKTLQRATAAGAVHLN